MFFLCVVFFVCLYVGIMCFVCLLLFFLFRQCYALSVLGLIYCPLLLRYFLCCCSVVFFKLVPRVSVVFYVCLCVLSGYVSTLRWPYFLLVRTPTRCLCYLCF